jgi:hypothetical protein
MELINESSSLATFTPVALAVVVVLHTHIPLQ